MSEKRDTEHLDPERLSALLDAPDADAEASAHLERCPECQVEFETLSRMRMALSGLGELEPPEDEWTRIEAALRERGLSEDAAGGSPGDGATGAAAPGGRPPFGRRLLARWPAQAAAAVLLFAGGILAGLQMTGGPADPGRTALELPVAGGAEAEEAGPASSVDMGAAYLAALEDIERLAPELVGDVDGLDPGSAAERLARIEALIRAAREAVRENPADPVANALLFQLVEQREELASRLNQSLHLVTLEYR